MYQSGMVAALVEHLPNEFLLADLWRADEPDLQVVFAGQLLGVVTNLMSQGFGKARIIKDADVVSEEVFRHPLGIK